MSDTASACPFTVHVGLSALLALGAVASAEPPAFSCHRAVWAPDGRSIVFMSTMDEGEEGWELYLMSLEGPPAPKRLTRHPGWDGYAAFSPDGSTLVFDRKDESGKQVWLLDLSSGEERLLVDGAGVSVGGGRFSPDGSRIVFFSEREGNREIYSIRPDGSDETRLTNSPDAETDACFTPDGKRILFVTWRDGSTAIEVVNTDGSERAVLLEVGGRAYGPDFSPDGSQLVFNTDDGEDDSEIYIMDFPAGKLVKLTENDAWDHLAVFSPDGSRLLFTSYISGVEEIYTMRPDGTDVQRVAVE